MTSKVRVLLVISLSVALLGGASTTAPVAAAQSGVEAAPEPVYNVEDDYDYSFYSHGCIWNADSEQIAFMTSRMGRPPDLSGSEWACWWWIPGGQVSWFSSSAQLAGASRDYARPVHRPSSSNGDSGGCTVDVPLAGPLPAVVAAVFPALAPSVASVVFVHCRAPHGHGKGLEHFPDRRTPS